MEVDPAEVIRHLNILGYTDIEPGLLNEFIKGTVSQSQVDCYLIATTRLFGPSERPVSLLNMVPSELHFHTSTQNVVPTVALRVNEINLATCLTEVDVRDAF